MAGVSRRFEEGNPSGNNKKQREALVQKKLTKTEFIAKIGKYSSEITFKQLGRIVSKEERGDQNVMDLWIASIIYKGIADGDEKKLTSLMEKVIGKLDPPQEVNITHNNRPASSMWDLSSPED